MAVAAAPPARAIVEKNTLLGQLVQVRCLYFRVVYSPDRERRLIVGYDEEDVWFLGRGRQRGQGEQEAD